ncbi:helix-turn-helix domain-containing protein (plasmid) [Skermanella rosea]|uniref:helix-turn-helix domain-containing protein n=1 Tax=Skermanella rosea TaxID=1817965 RepID=UPI001932B8AC|nr:helix-turn-helix transcriptional regulator [Skermanella rosea]UEM08116.1 helix-turn-helix domain-containing protein [Skermanella rosea]
MTNKKGSADLVDVYVGNRLKLRRIALGISQQKLASEVDITFQQVQKYESGKNRISASRLHRFALVMGVQIGWFFDGLDEATDAPGAPREALVAMQLYGSIRDDQVRLSLRKLMQSIVAAQKES